MDKEDSVPQEEISDSKNESNTKTEESPPQKEPPQKEEPAPQKSTAPAAKPEKTVECLTLTSITSPQCHLNGYSMTQLFYTAHFGPNKKAPNCPIKSHSLCI